MTLERELHVDGAFNVRDLGGIRVRDGRRIRPGVLLRSSALHDLGSVLGLGVRTVVDLRGGTDVERDAVRLGPIREHSEVRRVSLPLVPNRVEGATTSEYLNGIYGAGISAGRYSGYLEVGWRSVRDVFRLLGGPRAFPALVHCSAGKDRTGVLIALVLDVLGAPADAIVGDYARSNQSLAALIRELRGEAREAELSESDLALLRAPPEAMQGFLDRLHAEHGSARDYLASIGVGAGVFDTLDAALLGRGSAERRRAERISSLPGAAR